MAESWKINKLADKGGKLFERDKDKIGHTVPHSVIETVDKGSSSWPDYKSGDEVKKEVSETDC